MIGVKLEQCFSHEKFICAVQTFFEKNWAPVAPQVRIESRFAAPPGKFPFSKNTKRIRRRRYSESCHWDTPSPAPTCQ